MKDLARLLNDMREAGILSGYAVFGAVAQMRYTEPVATLDADVLVAVPAPERLDLLHDVHEFWETHDTADYVDWRQARVVPERAREKRAAPTVARRFRRDAIRGITKS